MKASILTFSQTGNTLKVADAITKGLEKSGVSVSQVRFLHRKKWHPDEADIIGIGCPCFESQPAECVPNFLSDNGFDFSGKKAFVFITSGGSPAKTLWRLAQAVSKTGADVIGGIQIRGAVTVPTMFGLFPGRPDSKDLQFARAFGTILAASLHTGDCLPDVYQIKANDGGRFYDIIGPWLTEIKKRITPAPNWQSDKCTMCGNCTYECPTGNISIGDKAVQFHDSCMVCYRCWNVCPANAIDIVFSPGSGWIERHLYSESMERRFGNVEPQEFYGTNLYEEVLTRKIKLTYHRKIPTAEFKRVNDL